MQEYLMIGEITKPQGVRGEVKIRPITCDAARFDGLTQAFFKKGETYAPIKITSSRLGADAAYLKIEGVDDRNAAEALRGEFLYIDRAHAVELDEDSTFICDLYGLKGVVTDGRDLGKIVDVMQPGGNDVYVFKGKYGEVLVPALRSVVLKVDLQSGEMLLDAKRVDEVAVFDED